MSRQVTCIKRNADRITNIGGSWGIVADREAIQQIKSGTQSYYVRVGMNDVRVVVTTREGREYLKTERDGTRADNLLSLPEYN